MELKKKIEQLPLQELKLFVDQKEKDRIQKATSELVIRLMKDLDLRRDQILTFGSFTRNTMLPRTKDKRSDVDLLLNMSAHAGDQRSPPLEYLKRIKRAVNGQYRNNEITRDPLSVTLIQKKIQFDLVPGFPQVKSKSFKIPNGENGWMKTSPKELNDLLTKKNKETDHLAMSHLIRLLKYWNVSHSRRHKSSVIESRVLSWKFKSKTMFEAFCFGLRRLGKDDEAIRKQVDQLEKCYRKKEYTKAANILNQLLPGFKKT